MYRPAWRMNQTGVASTGCRRQARRKRLPESVRVCSRESAHGADTALAREWMESRFGQNPRRDGVGHECRHANIVADAGATISQEWTIRAGRFMLDCRV